MTARSAEEEQFLTNGSSHFPEEVRAEVRAAIAQVLDEQGSFILHTGSAPFVVIMGALKWLAACEVRRRLAEVTRDGAR